MPVGRTYGFSVVGEHTHCFSDCFNSYVTKHFFCWPCWKVVLSVDSCFLLCQRFYWDCLRVTGNEQFPGRFPVFHRDIYNKATEPHLLCQRWFPSWVFLDGFTSLFILLSFTGAHCDCGWVFPAWALVVWKSVTAVGSGLSSGPSKHKACPTLNF